MQTWKCVCGNYNVTETCCKCGLAKEDVIKENTFFDWQVHVARSGEIIEKTCYTSNILKFEIKRNKKNNVTRILVRVMAYKFESVKSRSITLDYMEINSYLHDEEIIKQINQWCEMYRGKINQSLIMF